MFFAVNGRHIMAVYCGHHGRLLKEVDSTPIPTSEQDSRLHAMGL